MKKNKVFKKLSALLLCLCMTAVFALPTFAFSNFSKVKKDDAYVIGRTTSYVNPDTGLTADGGKNNPMGTLMANTLVDKKLMTETVNGKTYITFSMAGMSFAKDFSVRIVDKDGNFRDAEHKVTYSDSKSLGTQHFRIEIKPTDKYINPGLFINVMGKRMQFFIIPDFSSAVPGCGPFVSEFYSGKYEQESQKDISGFVNLIPGAPKPGDVAEPVTEKATEPASVPAVSEQAETSAPQTETAVPETTTTTVPEITIPAVQTEEETSSEEATEATEEKNGLSGWIIAAVVAAVVIIAAIIISIVLYKRKHFI